MPFPTHPPESRVTTLQFAVQLRDAFADSDQLLGDVKVSSGAVNGVRKDASGTFLFYNLKAGQQALAVRSGRDTPYYVATDIAVNVPMPSKLWPAFPDVTLADTSLPLGDPGQTAAYKAQRTLATLLPTNAYPFPPGSTLIRGTVTHAGAPLSAATVQIQGTSGPAYVTGSDGQFVLFLPAQSGLPQQVTVNAKHAALADGNANVTVLSGLTVSVAIDM